MLIFNSINCGSACSQQHSTSNADQASTKLAESTRTSSSVYNLHLRLGGKAMLIQPGLSHRLLSRINVESTHELRW